MIYGNLAKGAAYDTADIGAATYAGKKACGAYKGRRRPQPLAPTGSSAYNMRKTTLKRTMANAPGTYTGKFNTNMKFEQKGHTGIHQLHGFEGKLRERMGDSCSVADLFGVHVPIVRYRRRTNLLRKWCARTKPEPLMF